MVLINILTRTGKRENYYQSLKNSIELQSHKHIRHIKSNDNVECSYLNDEKDVVCVIPNRKAGNAFYNLYLNDLGEQVKEGWVIIMDDDSKLIDTTFIEELSKICDKSSENEVIIYKTKIYKHNIIPNNENFENKNFYNGGIDMSCFCVHYSIFSDFKFKGQKCGDYNFLNTIRDSNKHKFKYVDLPIGIWANYDGAKNGK